MAKSGKNINCGYYVVAYLDLLGQRELLKNMDKLPDTSAEKDKLFNNIKATYGRVKIFREQFKDFYDAYAKNHMKNSFALPINDPLLKKLRGYKLNNHVFSDTIIYYSPLAESNKYLGINNIYNILASVASIQLMMLFRGIVFRGGIDVGIGAEILEDEIYGNALYKAYELENKIACYPRVVLGKDLMNYINASLRLSENSIESNYQKGVAELCMKYLVQDFDKNQVINPRTQILQQYKGFKFNEFQTEALCFVRNEIARFTKERNEKLLERYKHLENLIK